MTLALERTDIALAGVTAAIVIGVGAIGSPFAVYLLSITAIYATVVVSLNLLIGLAGQASFAQTAFMAIGGYGAAILTTAYGWNPWLAMLVSSIAAVLVAIIVGLPLFRLRGHYFSMATFALGMGAFSFVTASPWTNGAVGIVGVPPLEAGPISFASPKWFLFLSWAICAGALVVYVLLSRSHIGRAWRALAEDESVAAALGVSALWYKLLAFAVAAWLASIAGTAYVQFTSFVGPDLYDIFTMLYIFLMLFIGGRGTIMGPVLGAAAITILPQMIGNLGKYQSLVVFSALLTMIVLRPDGLVRSKIKIRT
jgi:branched-chain amino acid transport system permease protein